MSTSVCQWSQDSLLVRVPDLWSKGCEHESQLKQREIFLLQSQLCVPTLIRCPFHLHVMAVACKRPQSFCQKCRWQITPKHAHTLDPSKSEWADFPLFRYSVRIYQEMSSHATCQGTLGQSSHSQLTEPLWTVPCLKSAISLGELISTLKKKKSRWGMNCWTFSPNPCTQGKSHHSACLGKITASTRAALPSPTSVCVFFVFTYQDASDLKILHFAVTSRNVRIPSVLISH